MTDKIDIEPSGEERLKARRNRLFLMYAIGLLVALLLGFATGYLGELFTEGAIPAWVIAVLWGLGVILFGLFAVGYFRRVDELVVLDNLWATLLGFYTYAVLYPSWFLFWDLGIIGEPDHLAIYAASMAISVLAYGARKLGFR